MAPDCGGNDRPLTKIRPIPLAKRPSPEWVGAVLYAIQRGAGSVGNS